MLTKLTIRKFKRFENADIELGNAVVFIGPNNSGKTTALQAIALWEVGLRRWRAKRAGKTAPEKRPGVTINRRDLLALPVPNANLIWRGLRVRDVSKAGGKQITRNIRIDIIIEGVTNGKKWRCGLEFDYANEESFYCRPLRLDDSKSPERMAIPDVAYKTRIAFLPPMSGLATNEVRLDPGALNVLLGEGRTAEVLRNLCYRVLAENGDRTRWQKICDEIQRLFGVSLNDPVYNAERGDIELTYRDQGVQLDMSSAGRGLQQTLLVLAHLVANPGCVLLIDEPDAHLEILRQREIYQLLTDSALEVGSQIIAASHSEVVLNEAADRDVVVAFVGRPHRIDDRAQVAKALKEIGFDQYYQAETQGWILYLEGATDLTILLGFARSLAHPAQRALERPFVKYVGNQPIKARDHFYGLREAMPDLVGFALFDRINKELHEGRALVERMWSKCEIENYICREENLLSWAKSHAESEGVGPLFSAPWAQHMRESIEEISAALAKLNKGSPWSPDTKVSDEFLTPLFRTFFARLELPNMMNKTDFHVLTRFVPKERVDDEVVQVLDDIYGVAQRAQPLRDEQ